MYFAAVGILVVGALLLAAPARCQEARRLTLKDAIDLAERQNLDLAAARLRHEVTAATIQTAKQIPNPIIHFVDVRDTPHQSLFFTQPIETAGKRHRRIEVAKEETKLTDVEISTLSRNLRRNVRDAFYNLALARATTNQQSQALQLAQRLHDIAQQRFQAGDVPQLELIQADLGLSQAKANFEIAQQDEKVALSHLNMLLNQPATTAVELVDSLETALPTLGLNDLISRAQASNPELQHLSQEKIVEANRHSLLKAQRVPDVEIELGLDFNSPPSFQVGGRSQVSVMLPIFSRYQGELAQSSATERLIDREITAAMRKVAATVEEAYLELRARQTQVDLYRQTLRPAAIKLAGMSEDAYRAGKSNILVVLDSQRNVQQVEHDYLASEFVLQTAYSALEETIGTPFDQ